MQAPKTQRLAFALAILALAGCSESTAPDEPPLSGDYALASVDGHPLPVYSISFEGGAYYIASLQVHLETGGRLAPYYIALERDSVVFTDGKPIVMTNSYGGGLALAVGDSLFLASFPGANGKGHATGGTSFTLPTTFGILEFNRME